MILMHYMILISSRKWRRLGRLHDVKRQKLTANANPVSLHWWKELHEQAEISVQLYLDSYGKVMEKYTHTHTHRHPHLLNAYMSKPYGHIYSPVLHQTQYIHVRSSTIQAGRVSYSRHISDPRLCVCVCVSVFPQTLLIWLWLLLPGKQHFPK